MQPCGIGFPSLAYKSLETYMDCWGVPMACSFLLIGSVRGLDIPQSVYPFTHGRTSDLIPVLGYD